MSPHPLIERLPWIIIAAIGLFFAWLWLTADGTPRPPRLSDTEIQRRDCIAAYAPRLAVTRSDDAEMAGALCDTITAIRPH